MSKDRQADAGPLRLPGEPVDWLTRPLAQFLDIEAAAGAGRPFAIQLAVG